MKTRKQLQSVLVLALALAAPLAALAQSAETSTVEASPKPTKKKSRAPSIRTLQGTISWQSDTQLEHNAIVNVWLQEVAPLAVVANIVAKQVIRKPSEQPIAFRLKYDPRKIQKDGRYYLLVKIYEGDRTRFINVARYPVINEGCVDQCEVVVDQMN